MFVSFHHLMPGKDNVLPVPPCPKVKVPPNSPLKFEVFNVSTSARFFFFFFLADLQHVEFPGQGSDPSWSCNLCHSRSNVGFPNPLCLCLPRGSNLCLGAVETPPIPSCHSGNSSRMVLIGTLYWETGRIGLYPTYDSSLGLSYTVSSHDTAKPQILWGRSPPSAPWWGTSTALAWLMRRACAAGLLCAVTALR